MLINADLSGGAGELREAIGAGEPLNPEVISQVEQHWGLTIRDGFGQTETTASIANPPGQRVKAGSMGRPLPGRPGGARRPGHRPAHRRPRRGRDLPRPHRQRGRPAAEPDDRLPGRRRPATTRRWPVVSTTPATSRPATRTATSPTSAAPTTSSRPPTTRSARSSSRACSSSTRRSRRPPSYPLRTRSGWPSPRRTSSWRRATSRRRETARSILAYAREHLPPYLRVRRLEFAELPKTISGKIRRVELRTREEQLAHEQIEGEWRDDQFPDLQGVDERRV